MPIRCLKGYSLVRRRSIDKRVIDFLHYIEFIFSNFKLNNKQFIEVFINL
jgi:hypothetical protein